MYRFSRVRLARVEAALRRRRGRSPSSAAAARYGFAEPSTERISMRPGAGMRIACVRLFMPYVAYAGDHVAPDVGAPTPMRLYELTVGAMRAMPASMCSMMPARNW